jgi:hypothetical protein
MDYIVSVYNFRMKNRTFLILTFSLILLLATGCAKNNAPSLEEQVRIAVAATIAAMPQPTDAPPSTPQPIPTAFNLTGLFCEYQFCIGHPIDMAFFDVSAQQNPVSPSTYSQGILAAFNGNLFIQVIWQTAPGSSDPKFLLDTILEANIDTREGTMDVMLVRGMNTLYTPITTTATSMLPHGGAGAWVCGDRVFAWKTYTPQAESARPLFDEALARFTCGR